MKLVEARVLCPGDVILSSNGYRLFIKRWELDGDRVWLQLSTFWGCRDQTTPKRFSVPQTTRFLREDAA